MAILSAFVILSSCNLHSGWHASLLLQVTSQRLSIGMTPKTQRLPKRGEILLSVRGSPLGVFKEDNMEAINGTLLMQLSWYSGRYDLLAAWMSMPFILVWKPLIIELSLRPCIVFILMDKSLIAESGEDWLDLYNPISHCLEDAAFAYLEVFCDCTNV